MTMDANELRALADALIECGEDAWPTPPEPIQRAADYLRAQADAQPVAWRTFDGEGNYDYRAYELNEDYADEWNRRNPNHVGWVETLYTHAAPAAPQAEPCIGNDPRCPCQDGDACHYKDSADGTKAWPVPQSEPKRDPTCLWSRADDDTDTWETACRHAFTLIEGTPTDNSMAFCCYCGRPLEQEIGGSDAE